MSAGKVNCDDFYGVDFVHYLLLLPTFRKPHYKNNRCIDYFSITTSIQIHLAVGKPFKSSFDP
jgi:hypothetical protein